MTYVAPPGRTIAYKIIDNSFKIDKNVSVSVYIDKTYDVY